MSSTFFLLFVKEIHLTSFFKRVEGYPLATN